MILLIFNYFECVLTTNNYFKVFYFTSKLYWKLSSNLENEEAIKNKNINPYAIFYPSTQATIVPFLKKIFLNKNFSLKKLFFLHPSALLAKLNLWSTL